MIWVLLLAFLLAAFLAVFFWKRKKAGDQRALLESQLPPALFSAASISPSLPFETALRQLHRAAAPPFKGVLSSVLNRLEGGLSMDRALRAVSKKHDSKLLDRAFLLLSSAYASGADLSGAFRTIAEDAFESQALESERKASFALQKYTLYAGVLVVPAVLGSLWSWAPPSALSNALWLGLHAHLFFFSVLSAAFIGAVERNLSSLGMNACVFIALGFCTFYATSGVFSTIF